MPTWIYGAVVVVGVFIAVGFLVRSKRMRSAQENTSTVALPQSVQSPSVSAPNTPSAPTGRPVSLARPKAILSIPPFQDFDQDGLYDREELRLGRNPQKPDFSFTGPDDDKDGLPNQIENWFGTDSHKVSSSIDGTFDLALFEAIRNGAKETAEDDQDGLTNYAETHWYKSDPKNSDTDSDGFKDGEEVLKGYNPKGAGKL